uniref:SET domain-containing protein n=2 Tax=Rhizophora mucronata TaxID=61149 RepID=A0A2P2L1K1_RHIMU
MKMSSKTVDEEGSYKGSEYNGKNQGRDYTSANRLKRHGFDSDTSERKHLGDYEDYAGIKSRRLSEDSTRAAHSEYHLHHSVERYPRHSVSSKMSSDKYSSKHHELVLSSKVVYDRHGRSPCHFERSPRDRSRCHDHRDRSPVRRERSPYSRERSPHVHERSPYVRNKSPYRREKSPQGREKSPYSREGREKSPYSHERSPYDRSHHSDRRKRSPTCSERSPRDRVGYHDRRDRNSTCLERSPLDRSKPNSREMNRKGGTSEKRISQRSSKEQEDKLSHKDSNGRDSQFSAKESQDRSSVHDFNASDEKNVIYDSHKDEESQGTGASGIKSSHVDGPPPEELLSMEEDMDICDTPPHAPVVADSSMGKWFYLDYFGIERGPSKLCDLRTLVDEGVLVSDHLIKHQDGDRWVTIENAVSPLVTMNYVSIVSNATTQHVSPPEAPGNLLAMVDTVDICHSGSKSGEEVPLSDEIAAASEPLENLHIDERVRALLDGFTVSPGRELETIGEVLQTTFQRVPWDGVDNLEGFTWLPAGIAEQHDQFGDKLSNYSYKVHGFSYFAESADWFSGRWSCKGGDWKRNDEAVQDRFPRRKFILNDGFPLCQMPKSGSEDPRWHSKDDLYYPSQSRRLDLPSWAYSCTDDRSECAVGRSSLGKPPTIRGVKGTALSVVRINACVVKDHGSIVSETRIKGRSKDRHLAKSARAHSANNDVKRSHAEGDLLCRSVSDKEGSCKPAALVNTPKDRLCMVDELQLHLGEWYYLDAAGHEQGPSSFSELQVLADKGAIQKHSSVFRKIDRLWVPVSSGTETSGPMVETQQENVVPSDSSSNTLQSDANNRCYTNSSLFHSQHPQFIGYMRGKLHQLVMKSYKSREFAAAINEVLDPWINGKQPKKEIDKHMYQKLAEIDVHGGKRVRIQVDDSDEDYKMVEDLQWAQKDETTFEELCGDASFHGEGRACSEPEMGGWGLLDGHVLARIFHFLRSDIKALAFASLTCKHWRAAVNFYKDISRQVNFSSVGPNCTDAMIWGVMNGYNKEKLNSMVLVGCTNVTSGMLEDILHSFLSISSVDIRGCGQFMDLALQFPKLNWLKDHNFHRTGNCDESHSKIRSLKQISERTATFYNKKGGDTEDFGELKEYFDSVKKRDSNQLFRRSLYKRSKLFDARRSSSIPSRDARIRQWAIKQSKTHYKRMEGFLALGLKDIMKENTFDFFVPKVAEIEERMKNGYYIGHGLKSVREDISRMCRDAIKVKNRGAGDMNRIIELFLCLASRLEESSQFSYEREELMKSWKDELSTGLGSSTLKHKKKSVNERKYMSRSNGSNIVNGSLDYGEYASDREIRKRLSKLNRKSMDSGSETSDEIDRSSEDDRTDDETDSDTESDLDFQSEGQTWESKGNGYVMIDDGYSVTDEREWGARMTKASLVPPVTRKYEIIDQYVIVADEENVQRKMCVSLPDDYAEKLDAQRNGTEELDMELPEVKEYKPRKQLGDEVIEQEVYGIDPHTYNLLLDSMPAELNWTLLEKQLFIEDVLLRTLNKQVRHFTGSGNTPMIYSLKPVVEEIEIAAEEDCDVRKMRMCRAILKAIDSRPDDKYVAYRKGLGVVCNKEGGFGKDDFVVEFLGEVYPAWKWFEKQDGIRSLQKDSKDPAPEFYNINLERPKGDADGYDLVVVDAMHKANYASRICHSCRPNCEAKVTAVDGHYQIGIYTLHDVQNGEEISFDYNSVTESKEEYEASVCLCGSHGCRGSYLNLTGEGAFQKVFKEWHGILDRHYLMLEACQLNSVSEEDYLDLGRAGLGSCLLGGLPDWLVAYSARLVRFINLERTKLPEEILSYNLEEKHKYLIETSLEVERSDAELQAEGVYNQRLQNLAITLDKVSYVLRCVFDDPKKALPPLERLSPEETVSFLWKGEGSLVDQLLQCMAPHVEPDTLNDLKSKIRSRDPTNSGNIQKELQKSLLWLRDELRRLSCTYKCRHDAAADLIHVYAYTKCFFRVREYKAFTSPPVYISPLDLGPKYADKLGPRIHEYKKTYGENYCLGQLIFWHIQTNLEPDYSLEKASRGCLSLPDIGSFYAKIQKPSQQRIYGPKTVKMMLERMEKYTQKPWPKDQIWSFKSSPKVFGSPMFDCVFNNTSLDKEMVHWLKHRPAIYQAMWDR